MKKMRTKPNYERAKRLAFEALERHQISDFPLDILSIFKSYKDIKVIKYSEMAKKRNCSIEEIIKANSSEDGSIHYCGKRNRYLIAYNDTIGHRERIYWTLAHEFGHYLLGHHKESGKSSLARNELNDEEYNIYEVEANFFTRYFLSPPSIIVATKMDNHQKIMDFFGISYTAAINTLNYVEKSFKYGFRFNLPGKIYKYLKKFILKVKYGSTCTNCNSFFYNENAKYCPICGSADLHAFFKGVEIKMKFSNIELNEIGRALKCPRCSNENVKGKYCNICATYLFNKCTGYDDYDQDFQDRGDVKWHSHNGGCGEILEGHARYCHECGSTSTFYEESILSHWQNTLNGSQETALTDDPFAPTDPLPDISDDDLPF